MEQNVASPAPNVVAKGNRVVSRLPDQWFVACQTEELGEKPISRSILGVPLVLFREPNGRAAALLDRCPHRNVPLSLGRVVDGQLQCGYHGWRFDGTGACRAIPGLCGDPEGKARRAPSYAVTEKQGFVWVYSTPDAEPTKDPFTFPHTDTPGYTVVRRSLGYHATLHASLENALDVPHTAFLHAGLFRQSAPAKRNQIEVVVRRSGDRVEAEYIGEPRPPGLAGRILSPSGGLVVHFDRFILPSVAQVEYRLGEENHFLVSTSMTPAEETSTILHTVVAFRMRLPGWLVKPILTPVAMRIFHQDAAILEKQAEAVKRFGGEQFVSTEIDILGSHIWKLLGQAERGEGAMAAVEEHVSLLV